MRKIYTTLLLIALFVNPVSAQNNDWLHIPGFKPDSPLTLTSTETFVGVVGVAGLSYFLAEYIFKNEENINFYTVRAGMNDEYNWALKSVCNQGFGLEHQVSSWFTVAGEINMQQWQDRTTGIDKEDEFGLGAGGKIYFRWYAFGKKRLSPYLEYGTGLFFGFEKFPYNGTSTTFNHSSHLGLEYTLKNNSRIRFSYGNFHQSNNGWIGNANPGYDGNGFNISYAWRIK